MKALITTLLVAFAFVSPVPAAAAQAEVLTDKGRLGGVSTPTGRAFLGVPFAAPPTGSLRWRPPQPVTPWAGVRSATAPDDGCPQAGDPPSHNEDCLYLNVYTPPAGPTGLPVLVWFHGGAYLIGKATLYDGTELARRANAVVVTTNYRLGVFGFLAHPGLRAEDGEGNGNYGIMDQQAALRWVQNNIRAFGGNPGNVTIFGESAGAGSVCTHLVAESSGGLFHRAVMQSGGCAYSDLGAAEFNGTDFADDLECDEDSYAAQVACMRLQPPDRLLDEVAMDPMDLVLLTYRPTFGGDLLPDPWDTVIAEGRHNKVPVLMGTTLDEGHFFVPLVESVFGPINAGNYGLVLFAMFQFNASEVAGEYPASDYGGDHRLALGAVITDWVFACPASIHATALAPVHFYEFADRDAPTGSLPPWVGAFHASELAYLFWRDALAPDQQVLSDQMVGYWAEFARRGNPNGGGRPNWPAFSGVENVLNLEPGTIVTRTDFDARHKCAFWADLVP